MKRDFSGQITRTAACRCLNTLCITWLLLVTAASMALAQVVTGPDWVVCYNLPSQSPTRSLSGEFAIRDTLTRQIERLRRGHTAELATYTLSGDSMTAGGAGPVLQAVSNALDRGASIFFVTDGDTVNRTTQFGPGLSLNRLSRRRNNPLTFALAPSSVLMHHKLGIFDFGGNEKWSFSASWNFTGGASINQWNIAVMIRNEALHRAFTAEMAEFRAGRFGNSKRRGHDGTTFRLQDSWGDSWVRFSPYHETVRGASQDAETDIRRLIDGAEHEIFFALNKLNRPAIRDALVNAVNRGVEVTGVIPSSDLGGTPFAVSGPTKDFLGNPSNFRRGRHVQFRDALRRADGSDLDSGQRDLVHCKYMVIDPGGRQPVVIHGSANWTAAGLSASSGNDENILFLRHRGIAEAFMRHFHRMTGGEAPPRAPGVARRTPGVEARIVQLHRTISVYSIKEPGKMVRLLRAGTPVKVMGQGTSPGMLTIRFNPYPGTIYEAQCRREDLSLN